MGKGAAGGEHRPIAHAHDSWQENACHSDWPEREANCYTWICFYTIHLSEEPYAYTRTRGSVRGRFVTVVPTATVTTCIEEPAKCDEHILPRGLVFFILDFFICVPQLLGLTWVSAFEALCTRIDFSILDSFSSKFHCRKLSGGTAQTIVTEQDHVPSQSRNPADRGRSFIPASSRPRLFRRIATKCAPAPGQATTFGGPPHEVHDCSGFSRLCCAAGPGAGCRS